MSLYDVFIWVDSESAWIIALILAIIAITISMYNIIKHLYNYTDPEQQINITRIIFIVPLYALISFLSLKYEDQSIYFEIIRDCYESFVLYCFLILILGYVGGEANCVKLISLKPALSHPCPCCCLPKMNLNVKFLRFCKKSLLQFVILKPLMAVTSIVLLIVEHYHDKGYQV